MKRTILSAIGCLLASTAIAQQGDGTDVAIATVINKPAKVDADPARMAAIKAPAGVKVSAFATGLKNARIIAVAPDGTVYVSRRDQGDVIMLKDGNGDGKADAAPVVVANRAGAHGLAIRDNKLYLVTVKELFVADIKRDGTLGELKMLIGDLPGSGQHPNRTIAWGPDDMLYLSVGSTCNTCNESNPENATMLRVSPDGKSRTIFATGLRNTIGFAWHPQTGELWGLDHGIDFLGDDVQKEELNKIERGKLYGWPHVYGANEIYPQSNPPGGITKQQWKERSTPMALGYTAHAAPMQLVFDAAGDAYATMRGSWNRKPASGYEIVRIRFNKGQPGAIEPFVTGFLTDGGKTHIARPVGLAWARDGALLMADDANGVIYRIDQAGAVKPAGPAPANVMREQAAKGNNVPLARERPEAASPGKLQVTSSAFADGVSPPLSWSAVTGAKSYAIIAEDPDAAPYKPFVHWLAWNIPANVLALPERVQEQARLTEPEGVLQGTNTRGSPGYTGPRPPVGDPAHRYYFQVFALDTVLDVPFGADRDQLLAAMKGHVLGSGVVMGKYAQKTAPPK